MPVQLGKGKSHCGRAVRLEMIVRGLTVGSSVSSAYPATEFVGARNKD